MQTDMKTEMNEQWKMQDILCPSYTYLQMTWKSYAHGCIPGFLTDLVKSYARDPAAYIVYHAFR